LTWGRRSTLTILSWATLSNSFLILLSRTSSATSLKSDTQFLLILIFFTKLKVFSLPTSCVANKCNICFRVSGFNAFLHFMNKKWDIINVLFADLVKITIGFGFVQSIQTIQFVVFANQKF